MLDKLVRRVMTPFVHKQGGVKTVVNSKEASCVTLLTINGVDTVLSNKRKADEISKETAKQRAQNGKR